MRRAWNIFQKKNKRRATFIREMRVAGVQISSKSVTVSCLFTFSMEPLNRTLWAKNYHYSTKINKIELTDSTHPQIKAPIDVFRPRYVIFIYIWHSFPLLQYFWDFLRRKQIFSQMAKPFFSFLRFCKGLESQ